MIALESWVNAEWMIGKTGKGHGMFPVIFVEVVEPLPSQPTVLVIRHALFFNIYIMKVHCYTCLHHFF